MQSILGLNPGQIDILSLLTEAAYFRDKLNITDTTDPHFLCAAEGDFVKVQSFLIEIESGLNLETSKQNLDLALEKEIAKAEKLQKMFESHYSYENDGAKLTEVTCRFSLSWNNSTRLPYMVDVNGLIDDKFLPGCEFHFVIKGRPLSSSFLEADDTCVEFLEKKDLSVAVVVAHDKKMPLQRYASTYYLLGNFEFEGKELQIWATNKAEMMIL